MDEICAAFGDYPDFGNHDYADYFCLLIYKKYEKICTHNNPFNGF